MEIKFIALPRRQNLEDMLRDQGRTERGQKQEPNVLHRYDAACWRIQQAQRKAACIAAEVMRPNDFRHAQMDYREQVRHARQKFEDNCVAIFSETCTKGL